MEEVCAKMAEWSAAIAAGTFIVLTVGIMLALRAGLAKLEQVKRETVGLQQELTRQAAELAALTRQELSARSAELGGLMQQSEKTMCALQQQLQAASLLFEAAGHVGGAIRHTTSAAEQAAAVLATAASRHARRAETSRRVGEAFDWAELGMTAWQLWQANRKAAAEESCGNSAEARTKAQAD